MSGQAYMKFKYGGLHGKRYNASFEVHYFLLHNDRKKYIDNSTQVIDLNDYKNEVKFGIQLKNLKVGLNNSHTKIRNKNHAKVFYVECYNTSKTNEGFRKLGLDSIKIGSKSKHFSTGVDYFLYDINTLLKKKEFNFEVETNIVDAVYNRKWKGTKIYKSLVFLPKKESINDIPKRDNKKEQKKSTSHKSYIDTNISKEISTSEKEDHFEQRLWKDIEDNVVHNETDKLIQNCVLYLSICKKYGTFECKEKETIYFYLIQNTEGEIRNSYIKSYNELFPFGKYCDFIASLEQEKLKPIPSVSQGNFDYDVNAMVLSNIYGGEKPYFVGFYDITKNKTLPIKTIRFSNQNKIIFLENVKLTEGFYDIKVFDTNGLNFIKPERIYLNSYKRLHKSIQLLFFITPILLLFVLYKKYITF